MPCHRISSPPGLTLYLAFRRRPDRAQERLRRRKLPHVLDQLLHRLKKDGMVSSIRGPRGGYVLSREAGRITVGEIVRVLDGTNGQAQARGRNGHRRASGPKEIQRYAQHIALAVQHCVHERLAQSLNEVTLQDLCDEVNTAAGEPLEHRYVFHI